MQGMSRQVPSFFALLKKRAPRTGVPEAHHNFETGYRAAVKAGIGGFHSTIKQLAGKACNEVLGWYRGFPVEPAYLNPINKQ